jgi:ferredoxin
MRVVVDWDKCDGHGMCELRAPRLFSVDEAGETTYAYEDRDVPAELEDSARAAVAACPAGALRLDG